MNCTILGPFIAARCAPLAGHYLAGMHSQLLGSLEWTSERAIDLDAPIRQAARPDVWVRCTSDHPCHQQPPKYSPIKSRRHRTLANLPRYRRSAMRASMSIFMYEDTGAKHHLHHHSYFNVIFSPHSSAVELCEALVPHQSTLHLGQPMTLRPCRLVAETEVSRMELSASRNCAR